MEHGGATPRRRTRNGGTTGIDRLRRRLRRGPDVEDADLFAAIARQVAERRRAWGLSQQELADLCGTTQSAIARIERGARPPRVDTLLRIATALDCELIVALRPRTEAAAESSTTGEEKQ